MPIRLQFSWNIVSVLTVSMVLMIALLFAMNSVLNVRRERAIFREQLESEALLIARLSSASVGDVLGSPEQSQELSAIYNLVLDEPDIAYFQLFDAEGNPIMRAGGEEQKAFIGDAMGLTDIQSMGALIQFEGDTLEVANPVTVDQQVIGIVQLGFGSSSLQARIREIAIVHLIEAMVFIAVAIPISYIIAQHFARPIRRLNKVTNEIARGELDIEIPVGTNRNDEIGELIASFSDMTQSLKMSRSQMQGMKDIAELGLMDRPRDELLQSLLEQIVWAQEADSGVILLYDEENELLVPVAMVQPEPGFLNPGTYRSGQGVAGMVLEEGMTIVIEDVPNSPFVVNPRLKEAGIKTMIGIPLKVGESAIGTAFLHYIAERSFDETQLSMIEVMAERVAQVIDRARMLEFERDQSSELARINETNQVIMKELDLAQERNVQSAKMAAVGTLAGGVAHEINNPLASILGFAQLAQQKISARDGESLEPNLAGHIERYTSYIEKEARRCAQIVSKLRSFTAFPEEATTPLDVNQLVEHAIRLTGNNMSLAGTKLETKLEDDLPLVRGYSTSLIQAFTNIISNAIRAMPEGGTLTITTGLGTQQARDPNPPIEIKFEDNGVGIAEENINKVFEPFYTTAEPGSGTGLGLYACYQFVRQHAGDVQVESRVGEGTTFTVTIPIADLDELATAESSEETQE